MFRFMCVMFYVVLGVKYQVVGRAWGSASDAEHDAWDKMTKLLDEYNVHPSSEIERRGLEYYKDGKPFCKGYWQSNQGLSPWSPPWKYATD